jgi:hypothetical protein
MSGISGLQEILMAFMNISEAAVRTAMVSAAVFCGVVAVGYLVRSILLRRLTAWADKTSSSIDDIVIVSIRVPSVIWMVMLGIYAALQFSSIAERQLMIIDKVLLAAGLLSITLALSSLISQMIRHHAARLDGSGSSTSLIQNIARIVVWATAPWSYSAALASLSRRYLPH